MDQRRAQPQSPPLTTVDAAEWHRRPGEVCEWLLVSGDLHEDEALARQQLADWDTLGVTDIIDVREERSDEDLVTEVDIRSTRFHLDPSGPGLRVRTAYFRGQLRLSCPW